MVSFWNNSIFRTVAFRQEASTCTLRFHPLAGVALLTLHSVCSEVYSRIMSFPLTLPIWMMHFCPDIYHLLPRPWSFLAFATIHCSSLTRREPLQPERSLEDTTHGFRCCLEIGGEQQGRLQTRLKVQFCPLGRLGPFHFLSERYTVYLAISQISDQII